MKHIFYEIVELKSSNLILDIYSYRDLISVFIDANKKNSFLFSLEYNDRDINIHLSFSKEFEFIYKTALTGCNQDYYDCKMSRQKCNVCTRKKEYELVITLPKILHERKFNSLISLNYHYRDLDINNLSELKDFIYKAINKIDNEIDKKITELLER